MKFATKATRHCPSHHLRYVATLLREIRADMEKNANTLDFKCTDFNSSTHVTVYAECIYVLLSKVCPRR